MANASCPLCQRKSYFAANTDALLCPSHGWISGLEALEFSHMKKIDALIEWMALDAHRMIKSMADEARRAING